MIADTARKNLIAIASAYAKATGKTLSAVSKEAYGNSSFLAAFKAGQQSVSLDKLDGMLTWFSRRWPEDVDLPYLSAIFMTPKIKR